MAILAGARSKHLLLSTAILAAAAVGYFALGGSGDEAPMQADASNDALVERGAEVYAANCAACHGANLEGQPNWRQRRADGRLPAPPHDASGHTWHHDDLTLFNLTKFGIAALTGQPIATDMPVYDGVLSDEDIWAVLAFIKSRWPRNIRDRHQILNERARTN